MAGGAGSVDGGGVIISGMSRGSVTMTRGFRVSVSPAYVPAHSSPAVGKWTFTYRIRIANESAEAARLISRTWRIINGDGVTHEVHGEGVVGQQPRIEPGEAFVYSSFCPLDTPWGTMEGSYVMRDDRGDEFEVAIGRFFLAAPPEASAEPDATSASE